MKLRLISLLFFGALCFIILPGNKNGRASESQKGIPGRPGMNRIPMVRPERVPIVILAPPDLLRLSI